MTLYFKNTVDELITRGLDPRAVGQVLNVLIDEMAVRQQQTGDTDEQSFFEEIANDLAGVLNRVEESIDQIENGDPCPECGEREIKSAAITDKADRVWCGACGHKLEW